METVKAALKQNSQQISLIAIAVSLILLIILIWNYTQSNKVFYTTLDGMWMASASFCNRSGIDGMMLYVGPDVGGYHKAYLLMYSDNHVVVSKAIELRFGMSLPSLIQKSVITKRVTITPQDPEDTLDDIMPSDQMVTLDLATGRMDWSAWDFEAGETRQYAEFYRDNISSSGADQPTRD